MNKIISQYFSLRKHCVTGLNAAILDGEKKLFNNEIEWKIADLHQKISNYHKRFQEIQWAFILLQL